MDWWSELIDGAPMKDGKSTPELKRWYRKLNRLFFNGELPDNVVVRWDASEPDVACTEKRDKDDPTAYVIGFNRKKNPTKSLLLSAMLHEMVHCATEFKDEHGPAFDKWHKRLVRRGAFKKGAVIPDVTLF
jgi:hypothetical protein